MADLGRHGSEWDLLGELDPLWAVLSDPSKKHGKWDEAAFFRTGEVEIGAVLEVARELDHPERFERALDFGCGVGRLSRALAGHFGEVKGVDVAESMVTRAREMNRGQERCEFIVNERDDLAIFPDAHFDFAYSNIVLQHLPTREMIFGYLTEMLRTLRPGGLLVFQLPSRLPLLVRLQPRRTLFRVLRRLGIREPFLVRTLGLHPIRMRHVPRGAVESFLSANGGEILRVVEATDRYFPVESRVYYVTRKP